MWSVFEPSDQWKCFSGHCLKKKVVICTPSGYVCPQSISHCQFVIRCRWMTSCTVFHCPPLCCYWVLPVSYLLLLPCITILCFACILCCLVFCCFRHSCFCAWVLSGPCLWFCIMGLVWMFCPILAFFPHTHASITFDFTFYIIDFCSESCYMWHWLLCPKPFIASVLQLIIDNNYSIMSHSVLDY